MSTLKGEQQELCVVQYAHAVAEAGTLLACNACERRIDTRYDGLSDR